MADDEISGSIAPPPPSALTTLDEPITATIWRDLRQVALKLRVVLLQRRDQDRALKELKNWDLWGPLLLCLILSIILGLGAPSGQSSLVFAAVFVIVWCGAAVVTMNAKLLGGNISFFQSVCVLGYCVFPLVLGAVVCLVWGNVIFRTLVVGVAFVWSTRASVVFMTEMVPENRRALAVYPLLLFYAFLSWLIVLH